MHLFFLCNAAGRRLALGWAVGLAGVGAVRANAPATPSLEFIPNKGQWEAPVRYAAALPGGRLFLQSNALTYSLLTPAAFHHPGEHAPERGLLPAASPGTPTRCISSAARPTPA